MRIAVYSDIHGNTPGLDAVHAAIDSLGSVDLEIFLGDALYGGPGAGEVVRRLLSRDVIALRGNHDADLADFERALKTLPESHQAAAATWNRWLVERLSPTEVAFLTGAPLTHRESLPDGTTLLFCHAAPGNTRAVLVGPDAREADRTAALSNVQADIVCTGHWHEHAVLSWRSLQLVCAGGIGLSPDGLSRWLLIEADGNAVRLLPRTVAYDVDEFWRLAQACAMPECLHPGAAVCRHREFPHCGLVHPTLTMNTLT